MLSICIPTYNRADLLDRCLTNIRKVLASNEASFDFEICISDNASTDHTSQIIDKHKRENDRIVSFRHEGNLGFATNFKTVLQLATHDWVVVIGDDDVVTSEFEKTIYMAMKTNSPLVVFSSEYGENKKQSNCHSDLRVRLSKPSDVLRTIGMFHMSFIGNLMFRRSMVQKYIETLTIQSAYPQTVLAWKLVEEGGVDLVNQPIVIADHSHRTWTKLQTLYTSLDMARIITDGPLQDPLLHWTEITRLYLKLLKGLPRALLGIRLGIIAQSNSTNPYLNITNKSLIAAYKKNYFIATLACVINIVLKAIPSFLINILFRR